MFRLETLLAIIHYAEQLHILTTCRCLNSILGRGAQGCVTIGPPFMHSNTANWSLFSDGPFIVPSTLSPMEHVKITGHQGSKREDCMVR